MKKTRKTLIRFLNIIVCFSCFSCKNDTKHETSESALNKSSNDIEMLKEYLNNMDKKLTDKDGFPLNYYVTLSIGKSLHLASSDTITTKYIKTGRVALSTFLNLDVEEYIYSLSLNGVHKKDVKLVAQIYNRSDHSELSLDKILYNPNIMVYIPELDEEQVRKDIIAYVTNGKGFVPEYDVTQTDLDASNKWINMTTNLIKDSNIFNYKSVSDLYKK